ncbi:MAG: Zn-ribbon domain-containing OB-fold protein [Syntrophobacteraceae bacterium]|nr:Zn-ribbon domain-containing OB-fold protein [Syntrophobacteraceae bacterium]
MYKLTHAQYFTALKENRLEGLKCCECEAITVPPKATCQECGSPSLEVTTLSGEGAIRTFTVIRVAPEGLEAPYIVVLAELKEGPWLMGNLEGIEPSAATMDLIGRPVKLGHRVVTGMRYTAGEGVVPLFSLAD